MGADLLTELSDTLNAIQHPYPDLDAAAANFTAQSETPSEVAENTKAKETETGVTDSATQDTVPEGKKAKEAPAKVVLPPLSVSMETAFANLSVSQLQEGANSVFCYTPKGFDLVQTTVSEEDLTSADAHYYVAVPFARLNIKEQEGLRDPTTGAIPLAGFKFEYGVGKPLGVDPQGNLFAYFPKDHGVYSAGVVPSAKMAGVGLNKVLEFTGGTAPRSPSPREALPKAVCDAQTFITAPKGYQEEFADAYVTKTKPQKPSGKKPGGLKRAMSEQDNPQESPTDPDTEARSNSDPKQKTLVDRIRTACEMNYDSYKAAGKLHGRGGQEEPYVKQLKMSTI